ncbi:MAG TPA: glycoside hydrolase [Betaproteobacteria bacterium]|nr:glycoside hydrolase [Betaproteobacteria bacterium]
MQTRCLDLILAWHFHQPDYRDYATHEYRLPWTYLHAMKDYSDMAAHLEAHPNMQAVCNFVPILLDQLEDYADQFSCDVVRDPLLAALMQPDLDQITDAQRDMILDYCFRCNHVTMVRPYPAYHQLVELFQLAERQGKNALCYLSGQYLADLLTWYHLAWTGETVRRQYPWLLELMKKGNGFSLQDRRSLFQLIGEVVSGLIPRYRALAESGQVEISTTPHYHPIAPILMDFNAAREAWPECELPTLPAYPGGTARVQRHLDSALHTHRARFGVPPAGVWPAEGGISTSLVALFDQSGLSWSASGEAVLANSLRVMGAPAAEQRELRYRPYQVKDYATLCFFRDDRLSDMIGFEYAKWHANDAVKHFINELDVILHQTPEHETPVVSVILDGENAWEYYPYNGYFFLDELYTALENHPHIHTHSFKSYLATREENLHAPATGQLPALVAGSWVYGTFSTWIGVPEKNRAWDLLATAKQQYDKVLVSGALNAAEIEAAEAQLCDCESSDWFWWFGGYNPRHSVESFDRLYRANLVQLYVLLKLPVPETLSLPISHGGNDAEAGGTMRRAS